MANHERVVVDRRSPATAPKSERSSHVQSSAGSDGSRVAPFGLQAGGAAVRRNVIGTIVGLSMFGIVHGATTSINFDDLTPGQTVRSDRYGGQGVLVENGPSGARGKVVGFSSPCQPGGTGLASDPFEGPSVLLRFTDGASRVTVDVGDFASTDEDIITVTAFADNGLSTPVATATGSIPSGAPNTCLTLTVAAAAIKAVEITSLSTDPSGRSHPNSVVTDNLVFDTLPFEVKLQRLDGTIEAGNDHSENTTLRVSVVYPSASNRAGTIVTSFAGTVTLSELAGTTYYDGQNGATLAPVSISVSAGVGDVVLKSLSNSTSVAGPPDARIAGTATGLVANSPTNPFSVDQWFDENGDQIIDWLDVQASSLLACYKTKPGEIGAVAGKASSIAQDNSGSCGATVRWLASSGPIGVSPVCVDASGINRHRFNLQNELSDTVIHESRHAWQNSDRAAKVGAKDDGNASTPRNDDDIDLFVEIVSFPSGNGLLESTIGSVDSHADPGGTQARETDAASFAAAHRLACP